MIKLIVVLLLSFMSQAFSNVHGQNITIQKNKIELINVFKEIKKQTGYRIICNAEILSNIPSLDLYIKNRPIEQALDVILAPHNLSYNIQGKSIVIRQGDAATSKPQEAKIRANEIVQNEVRGIVVDQQDQPVPGANVKDIKNNKATVTDGNGRFQLMLPQNAVLTISHTGYKTQEVEVGSRNDLRIKLLLEDEILDEVLVVAYGTQKRASFTGSASVLKAETFAGTPRSSAMEAIQGNVPGVISSSGTGQPGEIPNIRIRGIGSTTGASPLYVIDGIPVESSSTIAINPNDIESMSVLKDASAASLYGSRAANGVIIITTKKGTSGETVFTATTQVGANAVTLREDVLPLNTREMLELLREGWVNSGRNPNDFTKALLDNGVDSTKNTDWFNALTRRGNYQQYNVSASGGSEKASYYVSGSHYNAKAALLGSDFSRNSLTARVSSQARDNFTFDLSLKLSHRNSHAQKDEGSNANPVRMYKRYQPWLNIYKEDGTYDLSYANNYNPVAVVNENKMETNKFGLLSGLMLKYQILPILSIENQANLDFDYSDSYEFYKAGIGTARSNGGEAEYFSDRVYNFVNTTIVRYNQQFESHGLNAFVGYESQKVHGQGNNIFKENFLYNTYTLDNASANADGGSYEDDNTLNSAFVNVAYNFDSKYYLTGSFRRDGSSRFGYKNRYGNFWSLGASWNLLGESFIKNLNTFSDLRLRTSYGENGNQSLGNFEALALYGSGYDYMGAPGIILSTYGNPLLTWEKNRPFNVGLDYGFLGNRIRGTLEWYTRTTDGQLANVGMSATNGVSSFRANAGTIRNSGWEFEINTINIKPKEAKGFEWTTGFNISTLKNKVLRLDYNIEGDAIVSKEGDDFYRFYLVAYAGVDPLTGEAMWYTDNTKTTTTKKYAEAGRANFGSALPKFFGGLKNRVAYSGVSLDFSVFFNFGNEVYDNWGSNANSDGSRGFSATDAMPRYVYNNRWQQPGDQTDVPKIVYLGTQTGSSSFSSSRFLYRGDYIRLRDVTLGYHLPQSMLSKTFLGSVQFYARGSNLYTWIKDKRINFDPEVGIEGETDQNAPIYKTIAFGLDIRF